MPNPVSQKQIVQFPIREKVVDTNGLMANTWVRTLNLLYNAVTGNLYNTLYSLYNVKSFYNTTTETSILNDGSGSTIIPANLLYTGKVVRIRIVGTVKATSAVNQTVIIKAGSKVLATSTASITSSGDQQVIQFDLICRSGGSAGIIDGAGWITTNTATPTTKTLIPASTITLDTTNTIQLDITMTFATASPNIGWSTSIATIEQV